LDKTGHERGRHQHPELLGAAAGGSIDTAASADMPATGIGAGRE
jgi:hypothetical protein